MVDKAFFEQNKSFLWNNQDDNFYWEITHLVNKLWYMQIKTVFRILFVSMNKPITDKQSQHKHL